MTVFSGEGGEKKVPPKGKAREGEVTNKDMGPFRPLEKKGKNLG